MGQYHAVFNLVKQQWIDPNNLGDGVKLAEMSANPKGGIGSALILLLAACSGRGGGDFQSEDALIGSWVGNPLAIIGDYAKPKDVPGCNAQTIYRQRDQWEELSPRLRPLLERECEVVYANASDGNFIECHDLWDIPGVTTSHGVGDRTFEIAGKNYAASKLREAVRDFLTKKRMPIKNFLAHIHAKDALIK